MKEVKIQVRFNDLDGYGHVNNSVYLSYLEIARCNAFAGIFGTCMERGLWFVLVSAELKYKKFIKYGDEVFVLVKIGDISGVKFSFDYSVHDGNGAVYAEAKTVHAIFDSKTGRPIRIDDDVRSVIESC